jgi:hypothetical protein
VEGVAGKEAHPVHAVNIISKLQYFVARCLRSCVGNVFGLRSIGICFPSTRKLVTYTKRTVWSRVLEWSSSRSAEYYPLPIG